MFHNSLTLLQHKLRQLEREQCTSGCCCCWHCKGRMFLLGVESAHRHNSEPFEISH